MKLPFSVDLTGRVAVVTGAGGVLMSEFARALAACGARVALLDINTEAAEAVAPPTACPRRTFNVPRTQYTKSWARSAF